MNPPHPAVATLGWQLDGTTLRDAQPAATLLVGPDETEQVLVPVDAAETGAWTGDTPAGRVLYRRVAWTAAPLGPVSDRAADPGPVGDRPEQPDAAADPGPGGDRPEPPDAAADAGPGGDRPERPGHADAAEVFTVTWTTGAFERRAGVVLTAAFHNGSRQPVRLRSFRLLATPAATFTLSGDPAAWWLMGDTGKDTGHLAQVLPGKNERERAMWAGFGMPVPYALGADEKATDGRWRSFRDFFTLYTDRGEHGIAGAAVAAVADVDFDFRIEDAACRLEVISRMSDVLVEPGESRAAETVVILAGPYPETVDALNSWLASSLGRRTHRGPRVGWCSWYDRGPRVTAGHTRAVSRAAGALADRIPLDVIQVDDGYQRQAGDWECNDSFPEGWQPVVAAIQRAGATPGVWVAPLVVHETAGGPNYTCTPGPIVEVHPDWFQRRANGEMAGTADNWGPTSYWLDPTHPGAAAFIRRIMRRLRQEGFGYFKIDFNTLNEDTRWHDPKKTRLQAYRDLYRLYREELGEETYLLSCSGLTRGTIGYADASRIGPDSPASWREPHPCCLQDCIRAVGSTAAANGVFYANDPDVTYTLPRGKMTPNEHRTWHGFVGLLGGLALISEPLDRPEYQADASLRMLEILTPPAPERGRPFWPGVDPEHQRFGFIAQRPWGAFAAVLIYNAADQPARLALDLPHPGPLGPRWHAWSFWDGAYCGIIDNAYSVELAPHASRLLRLTPVTDGPTIVGSDFHISLGAAEIAAYHASADSVVITLTDAGARTGRLVLYSPRGLRIAATEGIDRVTLTGQAAHLWALDLAGRQRGARQQVRLAIEDA